jgi:hypothetical protein
MAAKNNPKSTNPKTPHTNLEPERKKNWRLALYAAMLEIRSLSWEVQDTASAKQAATIIEKAKVMGAIADWSHNLAYFSAADFTGFDEDRAISEAASLVLPHAQQLKGALLHRLSKLEINSSGVFNQVQAI